MRTIDGPALVQANHHIAEKFIRNNQALEKMEGASFHRQSFERADNLQKALVAASCTTDLDDWAKTLDIAPILNDETSQRMVFCPGLGCFKAWRRALP